MQERFACTTRSTYRVNACARLISSPASILTKAVVSRANLQLFNAAYTLFYSSAVICFLYAPQIWLVQEILVRSAVTYVDGQVHHVTT